MTGTAGPTGEAPTEPPGSFVAAFQDREGATLSTLEEIDAALLVGDAREARERIRDLAEHSYGAFITVCLSLNGVEAFFEDVADQLDEATADRLRRLRAEYDQLATAFRIVRDEVDRGRQNPVTNLGFSGAYRESEAVPLVRYQLHSGAVELLEGRESPAEVLQVAAMLVGATTETLEEAVAPDDPVNTDARSALIDRRGGLGRRLLDLEDHLDDLRQQPVEE
jgi:hypothetical protein